MLASLDPHSAYLTPELYKELQVETKGSFGGLGIEITNRNGMLTVVAPIEDTPAYRAGIKPQDVILKIDGEFTKDMSLVEAVKKMRGPKNTQGHASPSSARTPHQLLDVTLDARGHQDPEREVEGPARTATATCASRSSRSTPTTTSSRRCASSRRTPAACRGSCSICATTRAACSPRR